jgi:signal transduction histidine kinase
VYSYHTIEHPGRSYVVATAASLMVVVVRFTLEGGAGIAAEMLERIFRPFNELDHSGVPRRGSREIGLAHATRLVLLQGGSICAHSNATGQGNVWCVRLPVLPARPP